MTRFVALLILRAIRYGVWTKNAGFVSPLFIQVVYRYLVEKYHFRRPAQDNHVLHDVNESAPAIEQLIVTGLLEMKPTDFDSTDYHDGHCREEGLSARWGLAAGAALCQYGMWMMPVSKRNGERAKNFSKSWIMQLGSSFRQRLHVASDCFNAEIEDKL